MVSCMSLCNPSRLYTLLTKGQRLLGLDIGSKTLGLALSDVSLKVATPFLVVRRRAIEEDIRFLIQIIHEQNVGGLVVGLPLQMNGLEGSQAAVTRALVYNILRAVDISVTFWDERLSSAAVERMLRTEANLSRQHRRNIIDKVAAAYILQGALDFLNR